MNSHALPLLGLHPAARGESWSVVAGDALELLDRIPPASVDLAVADPPYHLSNGGTTCRSGKRASVNKGEWDASHGLDEDHAFQVAWLRAIQRVLKPSGTLWVSGTQHVIFSIGYALQELGYRLLNTVTWQKPNAPPLLAPRYLAHSTELLIWASPVRVKPLPHLFDYFGMKRANGGRQLRDVWRFPDPVPFPDGQQVLWSVPTPGPREKVHGKHPTQKPLALLERVVLASTLPGALVLDPFCGSGTTGVVAVAHGRRFVGVEREAEYVDLARRRLQAAERAGTEDAGDVSDVRPVPEAQG